MVRDTSEDTGGRSPEGTAPAEDGRASSSRVQLRRLGVLAVVASFLGIWGYVMYLSVFEGRVEPRDRLDDTTWTTAAAETCAVTRAQIARLPYASEVDSLPERAELLDDATDELEVMLTRLDGLFRPDDRAEARAVDRWLADYRVYLQDRREYADRFRAGLDEPFRVTDRSGFQIDVLIDDFARVNHMESCETPDDVG